MEPRFRQFLLDTLNWIDGSNVSLRELRDHLQDTLQAELDMPAPAGPSRPAGPTTRAHEITIAFGPLADSPATTENLRVYDVTKVADPSTRQHAFHNGKHYAMMEATCHHADLYTALLQPLAKDLKLFPSLQIYVACDHGRHRSAACAGLLHQLFLYLDIQHKFEDSWAHSSHPHDSQDCEACTGDIAPQLLKDLRHRWESANKKRR